LSPSGEIRLNIKDQTIIGRLNDNQIFLTYVPRIDAPYLALLQSRNVQIYVEPKSKGTPLPSPVWTTVLFLPLVGLGLLTQRRVSRAEKPQGLTEVLKHRLASGEITKEQYEELKRILRE